jgi:KDO2-lipid IV(A) lauroyltransferase
LGRGIDESETIIPHLVMGKSLKRRMTDLKPIGMLRISVAETRQGKKRQIKRKPQRPSGAFSAYISKIPHNYIVRAGKLLGTFIYILDRQHRRIVQRNLGFVYPEWSKEYVQRFSRRVFQNIGITFLEICQMTCFSREDILSRVRVRGHENLLNAAKGPQGGIMISAHLGNWEMIPQFYPCYLRKPLGLVFKRVPPKVLNRWVYRFRTQFGNIAVYKKGAMSTMVRLVPQGAIFLLLIDQAPKRSEGLDAIFFGRTVTVSPGAALLFRRCHTPVFLAFCVREVDGSLTLVVEPPLTLKRKEDLAAELQENVQIMTSAIEKAIRTYPDQWFWLHKRWKRHYPYLYPEDLGRRKRRREKRKAQALRVL